MGITSLPSALHFADCVGCLPPEADQTLNGQRALETDDFALFPDALHAAVVVRRGHMGPVTIS